MTFSVFLRRRFVFIYYLLLKRKTFIHVVAQKHERPACEQHSDPFS